MVRRRSTVQFCPTAPKNTKVFFAVFLVRIRSLYEHPLLNFVLVCSFGIVNICRIIKNQDPIVLFVIKRLLVWAINTVAINARLNFNISLIFENGKMEKLEGFNVSELFRVTLKNI